MRVTEKDQKIYKYILKMGFATVKQITDLFYNDIECGSILAKKRLKCLIDNGYIQQSQSDNSIKNIFFADPKFKKQTKHTIIVMDIYSQFYKMRDLDIIDFSIPKCFANKKVVSNAFIKVKYSSFNNVVLQNFIFEVETSNNDYRKTISKYNDPNVQADIKATCDGYSPVLVLVDNVKHDMSKTSSPYKLLQIDTDLTNFPLIFSAK